MACLCTLTLYCNICTYIHVLSFCSLLWCSKSFINGVRLFAIKVLPKTCRSHDQTKCCLATLYYISTHVCTYYICTCTCTCIYTQVGVLSWSRINSFEKVLPCGNCKKFTVYCLNYQVSFP